ncbi:AroM family protein [Paenibacillus flagellatus]|uniref:AroM protein n=1 Tax=Paenibacillus flagellatus TaxID=2211139 RepID=A0A2V5L0T4_9BACL|nr:AroM family protein [Paenibacillus flagellatus]PYI56226.1 AroM protein [Paenibacillus flagellatus]
MRTLGTVTIGQAPRPDVGPILEKHLAAKAELVQVGVLDGMTKEQVYASFRPEPGDYVLTSRLADGDSVVMAREKIAPVLQRKIDGLEERGCRHILVLCTGVFEGLSTKRAELLEPDELLAPIVAAMVGRKRFGVIVPLAEQAESLTAKWSKHGLKPVVAAASPYRYSESEMAAACARLKDETDIVLLDCMGYTEPMRAFVAEKTGLPVILSNALMAKVVSEMI